MCRTTYSTEPFFFLRLIVFTGDEKVNRSRAWMGNKQASWTAFTESPHACHFLIQDVSWLSKPLIYHPEGHREESRVFTVPFTWTWANNWVWSHSIESTVSLCLQTWNDRADQTDNPINLAAISWSPPSESLDNSYSPRADVRRHQPYNVALLQRENHDHVDEEVDPSGDGEGRPSVREKNCANLQCELNKLLLSWMQHFSWNAICSCSI